MNTGSRTIDDKTKPASLQWELRINHVTWSAELVFKGESWGWDARILRKSRLAVGQRFIFKASAMHWAEEMRQEIASWGRERKG